MSHVPSLGALLLVGLLAACGKVVGEEDGSPTEYDASPSIDATDCTSSPVLVTEPTCELGSAGAGGTSPSHGLTGMSGIALAQHPE